MEEQIYIETNIIGLRTRTAEDTEPKVDVVNSSEPSRAFMEATLAAFQGAIEDASAGTCGPPSQLILDGITKELGLIKVSDLIKVPLADVRDQARWGKWLRCVRQVACQHVLRALAYCEDSTKMVVEKAPFVLSFAQGNSDDLWIEISAAFEVSEAPAFVEGVLRACDKLVQSSDVDLIILAGRLREDCNKFRCTKGPKPAGARDGTL